MESKIILISCDSNFIEDLQKIGELPIFLIDGRPVMAQGVIHWEIEGKKFYENYIIKTRGDLYFKNTCILDCNDDLRTIKVEPLGEDAQGSKILKLVSLLEDAIWVL